MSGGRSESDDWSAPGRGEGRKESESVFCMECPGLGLLTVTTSRPANLHKVCPELDWNSQLQQSTSVTNHRAHSQSLLY